jgi:ribosomal protein L7/L12
MRSNGSRGLEHLNLRTQVADLNHQDRQAIEAAIFAGRKIEAIKLFRKATDSGLADAKRAIEDLEADLRRRSPEKFMASAQKKGCLGVVACLVLAFTAVLTSVCIRIL